ncbi:unnamed protein product [Gongylonema pulchrum]|uniref:Uncharacterized protein n=1 Tax=Gongylonema pulchrum TaxID=637853 RepID=A0A183EY74_9BILA|nr:unnamed protein product [Gongylonema pulchrum]
MHVQGDDEPGQTTSTTMASAPSALSSAQQLLRAPTFFLSKNNWRSDVVQHSEPGERESGGPAAAAK